MAAVRPGFSCLSSLLISSSARAVRQGWVVLQAVPSSFSRPVAWSDPRLAVLAADTDQSGAPDVTFGFTSRPDRIPDGLGAVHAA